MLGLGTGAENLDAYVWARQYAEASYEMGRYTGACPNAQNTAGRIAFGTDANSLVSLPAPPWGRTPVVYSDSFLRSRTGDKEWDYNRDGVAHYGMLADFIEDVRTAPGGASMNGKMIVKDKLMHSADYFYQMWLNIDRQKSKVP